MIELTTTAGDRYYLDDEGYVLARSNGPGPGWDYRRGWRIVGFKTRHNAHATIPLSTALDGTNVGQGWIYDWDHGTHRLWLGPANGRLKDVRRLPDVAERWVRGHYRIPESETSVRR